MTEKQLLKAALVLELKNLCKAEEAYAFISNEETTTDDIDNTDSIDDVASNDSRPDGVYLIYGDGSFELFKGDNPSEDIKYVGVKMGDHSLAVALRDIGKPDEGGDPQQFALLNRYAKPPREAPYYTQNCINAFEDFDGKANTERIKKLGSPAYDQLYQGEWIPSLGELGIIMMNLTKVNEALDYAGGDRLKGWHWSSTEYSQTIAWFVYFSDGNVSYNFKCNSYAVRAVAAF